VSCLNYPNLPDLFFSQAHKNASKTATYHRVKELKGDHGFEETSWTSLAQKVSEIAAGLIGLDVQKQDHIGILSNTRIEWMMSDVAIMSAGAVTVSLYHTCTPEELVYLINDSNLKILFVEDKKQLDKILKIIKETSLEGIVLIEHLPEKPQLDIPVIFLEELVESGRKTLVQNQSLVSERYKSIQVTDLATIIYTSGTSGQLKGVVISHENILQQLESIPYTVPIKAPAENSLLAFLPNAHVFQRIAGQWYFISQSCPVYFCSRIERVPQYLKDSKATIVLSVPMILERIRSKVMQQIEELPASSQTPLKAALSAAIELKRTEFTAQSFTIRYAAKTAHKILFELLLRKIKDKISPSLKAVISGGAPINEDTVLFFHAIGIYLVEGYGLTETTGIMTANSVKSLKLNSVGKPLKDVHIKTEEDGEILVSGKVVFNKYWNKPEETQEALSEGWFRTGDLGHIDKDGYLFITGRKKDLIINAGGKKISPVLIEECIKNSPFIDQIAVFGDKQKWLVALITLQREALIAKLLGQESEMFNWEEFVLTDEVKNLVRTELEKLCLHLADYERVKKFKILPESFSQAKGELTHTMKLKRNVIAQNYSNEIDELYKIN
jgi:long-chain acyl-CoA synthetase